MPGDELARIFAQDGFSVRFDWGLAGAQALAPSVSVLVIIDEALQAWLNDGAEQAGEQEEHTEQAEQLWRPPAAECVGVGEHDGQEHE